MEQRVTALLTITSPFNPQLMQSEAQAAA